MSKFGNTSAPAVRIVPMLLTALLLLALLATHAHAAAATQTAQPMSVDFSGFIDSLLKATEIYVIPPVMVALAAWVTAKLGSKLSAEQKAIVANAIATMAKGAAIFAAQSSRTAIANKGPMDVNVGDPRVAAFGNFMLAEATDLLQKGGIDTTVSPDGKLKQETVDTLKRMALAHLPAAEAALTPAPATIVLPATATVLTDALRAAEGKP